MSHVERKTLERVTRLDLRLMQRLRRRAEEQIVDYTIRQPGFWGPRATGGSGVEEKRFNGEVLGGLEVHTNIPSPSVLQITAGSMVATNASAGHETRPPSWSGRTEEDDHSAGIFHFEGGSITPTILNDPAWQWILVYGTIDPSKTIETNADYKVFNEVTGVFDTSSSPKILAHALTLGHIVGAPGTTVPALPSGDAFPIAWIWVPPSQTNLANAQIFDVRKLAHRDPGPNVVEGFWEVAHAGAITTPFTQQVLTRFAIRARLDGEWMEAIGTEGLHTVQIAEGGATFDNTATPTAPKIAWLYLCKPRGVVPRLKAIGAYAPGSHPTVQNGPVLSGCLVLSPNAPRLYNDGTLTDSARKWDLRNAVALGALPNQGGIKGNIGPAVTPNILAYQWFGMTADVGEGICVGMVLYTGVDVGGLPEIAGYLGCFDGWHSGDALTAATTNPFLANLTTTVTGGGAGVQVASTVRDVGGGPYKVPLDNVRAYVEGAFSAAAANASVDWTAKHAGQRSRSFAAPGPVDAFCFTGDMPVSQANSPITALSLVGTAVSSTVGSATAKCAGVRMPFGVPLVT